MQMMRYFWDAAASLDPSALEFDEAVRFAICNPESLRDLLAGTGLRNIETRAIDVPTVFADFDDYWTPFLAGGAPAPRYANSLTDARREELRQLLASRLPTGAEGSISLIARAWAVKGSGEPIRRNRERRS
jgi:hypothetical protein